MGVILVRHHNKSGILFVLGIFFLSVITFLFEYTDGRSISSGEKVKSVILDNLVGMNIEEVQDYAEENGIVLQIEYQYHKEILNDKIISQSKAAGELVSGDKVLEVVVSKGPIPISVYQEYQVNELGSVPIMMYHGIVNMNNDETTYIGGNVDKDGYSRTVEAFRSDLEFYYNNGYRMIRLEDYIDGIIDVELGKSPIILTFDDGNENNFKVLGEENGELLIDPNCAIGVLEEFKKKYPDYGVTATFFVNQGLFEQEEYDEKILMWLVNHGYDIGNHTLSHADFTRIGIDETKKEIGGLYQLLDEIIPNQYISIVALPFGSPYNREHENYEFILKGNYLEKSYQSKGALRVGWEAELSCFDKNFQPTFLKRIRAYDNEGKDFDLEMNFKILEKKRYISDGDVNTIVVMNDDEGLLGETNKEVILY